jgi:hypothetical protein
MGTYCLNRVERMGEDAENVHILALSRCLGLRMRVECVTRLDAHTREIDPLDESATAGGDGKRKERSRAPRCVNPDRPISLLYRPGHYDILLIDEKGEL